MASITKKYGDLIPQSRAAEIAALTKRSVSAMSDISVTSTTSEFIDAKLETINAEIQLTQKLKEIFEHSKELLTAAEFDEITKDLKNEVSTKERELLRVKRQKKTISDDIEEVLPQYITLEAAYSSVLTAKIMSASGKPGKQKAYAKGVLAYYGAMRTTNGGGVEKYCHLTGWLPEKSVKCAHLVPKSLESEELAYLFGDREAILSEPRNGITLNTIIEGGLDNGWIVIVPDKTKEDEETVWRCILTDPSKASDMIGPGIKWRDIDGMPLKFLTPNRPARRYLYLRYVITYLHQQKMGNKEWLKRVDARGHIWATPGPYLRKSMLLVLARRISDTFLPEAFYESTFESADGSPQRSLEEEGDLAMALDHKMEDALEGGGEAGCEEEDDEDDEE